eukprot:9075058-Pyramimonas_sp.AAC.1
MTRMRISVSQQRAMRSWRMPFGVGRRCRLILCTGGAWGLAGYAEATEQRSIASPIRFLCACTSPRVERRRGNQISWETPFKASEADPSVA